MKIHVLPDSIINKISAGEVIDRPASVVRELVDNALDAGAKDVAVYIEQGGHTSIRVVDDGNGMERDDAILAFQRHATSKVENEEDLNSISTFGFRGEALASIAAVAKVKLKTRSVDSAVAYEVIFDGGNLRSVLEQGGVRGTDVSVQHLFFNTPARRKFLKSEKSEELRIKAWLQQSSIANPKVRYRLSLNGKEVLNLAPKDSSLDRAATFFKGSTLSFQRSYPVRSEKGESLPDMLMEVEGIIGHPSLAQRETAAFVLFVNNRMISDKALLRAVKDGFDSTLKEREYPIGYLHIRMPPALVDVNVHPQKSEVRFWDQRILFGLVRDVVYQTVRNFKAPMEGVASLAQKSGSSPEPTEMISDFRSESFEAQALFAGVPQQTGKSIEQFKLSQLRYVGQIFDCYLLCESTDHFVIVDMHAAHERLNFNILKHAVLAGNNNSQMLLLPHTVNLSEESQARLLNQTELLSSFGFELEAFGPETVIIRAVPQMLDSAGAEAVLKEVAATEFEEEGQGVLKANIDEMAARIACHASIRSGVQLEREEVYSLFESLDSAEFSSACPHGRPVVASFSKMDVEKWFGRDR